MSEIRYYAAAGNMGRVIVARLRRGTDFMKGVKEICREHEIKGGYIFSAIGSFERTAYKFLIPKPDSKLGAGYIDEPKPMDGPIELLGVRGVITEGDGGEPELHVHATFCDENGTVYGGHLVEGDSPTLATVELGIIEVKNLRMGKQMDEEIGMPLLYPKEG